VYRYVYEISLHEHCFLNETRALSDQSSHQQWNLRVG
jgi:hypothetical protein